MKTLTKQQKKKLERLNKLLIEANQLYNELYNESEEVRNDGNANFLSFDLSRALGIVTDYLI